MNMYNVFFAALFVITQYYRCSMPYVGEGLNKVCCIHTMEIKKNEDLCEFTWHNFKVVLNLKSKRQKTSLYAIFCIRQKGICICTHIHIFIFTKNAKKINHKLVRPIAYRVGTGQEKWERETGWWWGVEGSEMTLSTL